MDWIFVVVVVGGWGGEEKNGRSEVGKEVFLVLKRTELNIVITIECCFTSTKTVGLLGTGTQDDHLDFHTQLLS